MARERRIPIMMSQEEVAAIDDWRFANRVATRSEAIRQLAARGLKAEPDEAERALDDAIEADPTFPLHGGLAL